ncbi:DUF6233 domain-containing protein [Streptomyces atroolivaceus]|uniref:DUF6233 domain-containing protein n=1 Tax=Streptomyces atroolivaceus TaxID=66869 RepID=UPI003662339C
MLTDGRESEAFDGCQGGGVVRSDRGPHGLDLGFCGGPQEQAVVALTDPDIEACQICNPRAGLQ